MFRRKKTVQTLEQAATAANDYTLTESTENDYVSIKGVLRWIRYFKSKQPHYQFNSLKLEVRTGIRKLLNHVQWVIMIKRKVTSSLNVGLYKEKFMLVMMTSHVRMPLQLSKVKLSVVCLKTQMLSQSLMFLERNLGIFYSMVWCRQIMQSIPFEF